MVVYDIGANCGQMSLLFNKLVGPSGKIFAFEPYVPAFEALKENVALNHLKNITARQVAVGDSAGKGFLSFNATRPTQSKMEKVEPSYQFDDSYSTQVQCVALDGEKELPPPNFIKIDVEGAAASVLKGAQKILESYSPMIYLELHGPEEQAAVDELLIQRGYTVESLEGIRVKSAKEKWVSPIWCYRK